MAINYAVWGQPNTWVDGSSTEQQAEIKFPMSTRVDFQKLWDNGFLPLNNIDTSNYFYGIGKDSIWCHPRYLYCYKDGGSSRYGEKETLSEIRDMPIMFATASSSTVYSSYTRRYKYGRTTTPIGNMYTADVVISFNYQKLMLIPFVACVAENASTTVTATITSLYDYIENQTYLTKPWIVAIGYKMRYGAGGDTNRTSASAGFTPLFDYQIQPYTVLTDSNYFWAGAMGCGILRDSSVTSGTSMGKPCGAPRARYSVNNDSIDDYTGFANRYCVGEGSSVDMFYYDDMWSINVFDGTGTTYWAPYPYLDVVAENADTMKKYILKQIAFLGLPFVYDPDNATRGIIGDIGVYLPEFDDNGVTTGNYEEGINALKMRNASWTDSRSSGYDPNVTQDMGDSGNRSNRQTSFNTYTNPNSVYVLTFDNFKKFATDVNSLYNNDPTSIDQMQIDFKGVNPSDYIVGCYGIPFIPNYIIPSATDDDIYLGPLLLPTAKGIKVDTDTSIQRDLGWVTIPAEFGDFRDYEPYTSIDLYVPMCGNIHLDPSVVIGRSINVIVYYDILTATATGCVYRDDDMLIATISGSIGATLPMTAGNMGSYQNSIKQTENALKRNEMQIGVGVASAVIGLIGAVGAPETGGASLALAGAAIAGMSTAASGVMKKSELEYQLTHTQITPSVCSSSNGAISQWIADLRPWVFIKRCVMLADYNQSVYAHTVGHSCVINATINDYVSDSKNKLIVCSDFDLSGINAPPQIISQIQTALSSGIYV